MIRKRIAVALCASIIVSAAMLRAGQATTAPVEQSKTVMPSGLTIITLEASDGEARSGDVVRVLYTGKLADGKVFDASDRHGNQPIEFPLGEGRVIKGWDQGVLGMKVGEKRQLIIPPDLAYGERGTPGGEIPPNATLTFDVELVGLRRR